MQARTATALGDWSMDKGITFLCFFLIISLNVQYVIYAADPKPFYGWVESSGSQTFGI